MTNTHTEAQWELAQGEIHDLRTVMAAVNDGVDNMKSGLWTVQDFTDWYAAMRATHDNHMLERFKNVMRRYPGAQIHGGIY